MTIDPRITLAAGTACSLDLILAFTEQGAYCRSVDEAGYALGLPRETVQQHRALFAQCLEVGLMIAKERIADVLRQKAQEGSRGHAALLSKIESHGRGG
jgi:hypothetical protein